MATTTVEYITASLTPETRAAVLAKATELENAGKTDGTSISTVVDNKTAWIRPWATETDAQEWIDFLNLLTPAPVSTQINP